MSVLSAADLAQFKRDGYLIVHEAVSPAQLERSLAAVHDFLGGPEPSRWYQPPHVPHGFLPMYHHPALWDNRQSERIYQAYVELLGQEELWVTFDRVSVKVPMHPDHPGWSDQNFIHWDCNPRQPPPVLYTQGVLSLTDTPAWQGGFQCVPGGHLPAFLEPFLARRGADWQPTRNDTTGELPGVPVPTRAGDLIIWNNLLPHGNTINRGTAPRYAQYINMARAKRGDIQPRAQVVADFHKREQNNGFPLDERRWEAQHAGPATLTPLGRKLVGLDPW